MESAADLPILGYWDFRGLGTLIALAYHASDAKYAYKVYPVADYNQWYEGDKPKLGMVLPDLPYLKDGDVLISEHDAIIRHILRKHKPSLLGRNAREMAEIDQYFTFWLKTNNIIRRYCYLQKDPTEADRKDLLNQFRAQLNSIDTLLAGRKYHMGDDYLTYPDIYLSEAIRMMRVVHKETAEQWNNINRLADDIEKEPFYIEYKASPWYYEQLNGVTAHINNRLIQ
ncbi:hypothetical protein FGO68_gene14469 [Halteria grandinella]|uniref:glutathione transferase n=1 Tax=Halteria grandinella TaxID=5974 RepID=A0A8J8NJJ5_HALGN|nr:hypothetical protein FGO68_gene14469 [Halteria grandinella]